MVTPKLQGMAIITNICHFLIYTFSKALNGCWKLNGGDNQPWLWILTPTDLWALPLGQDKPKHHAGHFCARAACLMRKIKANQLQMLLVMSLKTTGSVFTSSWQMSVWWEILVQGLKRTKLISVFSGFCSLQKEEHTRKTGLMWQKTAIWTVLTS